MQGKNSFAKIKNKHWSLKKWGLLVALIFSLQLLFFVCFLRHSVTPQKEQPSHQIVITTSSEGSNSDALSPYIAVLDPFLFSYSSRNGVTSPIWKDTPEIEYDMAFFTPLSSTIAPDEFYFLNNIDTLLSSAQDNRENQIRAMTISMEKIQEPEIYLPKPNASRIQLSENVKSFFEIPEITIPTISYNGALQYTEIAATIGSDGRILSAILQSSCGLDKADSLAMEITQGLRLLPKRANVKSESDETQNTWENLKTATISFIWSATPLK